MLHIINACFIFKWQEACCWFMTEKYGIKNKKQDYCPPHFIMKLNPYGAASPPIKDLLFSSHHSWTERFKCHSNSLQVQKQAAQIHSAARMHNGNLDCIHYITVHCPQDVLLTICYVSGQTFSFLWYVNHYMLHIYVLCTLQEWFVLCYLAILVWSKTSIENRWDTLPPRVGFLSSVIISNNS